ncbi:hypothetical protein [Symbiopectobacterium sp.]
MGKARWAIDDASAVWGDWWRYMAGTKKPALGGLVSGGIVTR